MIAIETMAAGDVPGTFDPNQALVLEFNQPSGLPLDGTAYKNNPTVSTAEVTPASLIGGGAKFSGSQSITVPASASLRLLPSQGATQPVTRACRKCTATMPATTATKERISLMKPRIVPRTPEKPTTSRTTMSRTAMPLS